MRQDRNRCFLSVLVRGIAAGLCLLLAACGADSSSESIAGNSSSSFVDESSNGNGDSLALKYTSGTFKDPRDKKEYRTVTIGGHTWMAQNLAYDPNNTYPTNKYGTVYDVTTAQKVCPDGWHLPSMEEWRNLFDTLDSVYRDSAAWVLKSKSGWDSTSNGISGNGGDVIGFSIEPSGYYENGYYDTGRSAAFWADPDRDGKAHAINISYANSEWTDALSLYDPEHYVRCINDRNTLIGAFGKCDEAKADTIVEYQGEFFTCEDSNWYPSTIEEKMDFAAGACDSTKLGVIKVLKDTSYTCAETTVNDTIYYRWRRSTLYEALGTCGEANYDSVKTYLGIYYVCDDFGEGWDRATAEDVLPKCTQDVNLEFDTFYDTTYICKDGQWTLHPGTDDTLGSCTDKKRGQVGTYEDTQYVCINHYWRPLNSVEKKLGVCTQDGATGEFDGIGFTCDAKRVLWKGSFTDSKTSKTYGIVAVDTVLWFADDLYYGDWASSPLIEKDSVSILAVCPAGFVIPSNDQWHDMVEYAEEYGGWLDLVKYEKDSAVNYYGLNLLKEGNGTDYWTADTRWQDSPADYRGFHSYYGVTNVTFSPGSAPETISSWGYVCNAHDAAGVCHSSYEGGIRCIRSAK